MVKLAPMPPPTTDQFGQFRFWLAAQNRDIDLCQSDAFPFDHLIPDRERQAGCAANLHRCPALYDRKDLLEKHGVAVPKTWEELAVAAQTVQDAERAAGNAEIWGFVWQGNAYEGLTCNALEWVKSFGGGQIVEPDGSISINNEKAIAALETAKSWVGTISPEGVLGYQEEEAHGLWQLGNAEFMRNWPYAYGLGNGDDSAVKGLFDVTTLPTGGGHNTSAATLGGWNIAVSKYGDEQEAAISLALYLGGPEAQKQRALNESNLPTIVSLYDDADIAAQQPIIPRWKDVFLQAVPRPSAPTLGTYNEVSSKFWSAAHDVLSGNKEAAVALEDLEADLADLKGDAWK
jgi:trehalose/maltose transport system substrate-binding protein